jgi:hypothetical protein
MTLTERERRLFLDLLDEEHARDRRTYDVGRTSEATFREQAAMYAGLRRKLVAEVPSDLESPPGSTPPG